MTTVMVWVGALALAGLLVAFRPAARPVVGRLALVAIGLVFVAAALFKAINPGGFTEAVRGYGLIPDAMAPLVTWVLVPFEMILGAALILDYRRRLAVGACVTLLAGFLGLMAYTAATGGDVSECGCFGSVVERSAAEVVAEDLGFMALALLGLMAASRRAPSRVRAGLVALAGVGTLAYMPFAADVPVEGLESWMARRYGVHLALVTRLSPGRTMDDLQVSVPDAAFNDGRHLVALLDLEQEDVSGPVTDALNQIAATPGAPDVAVLYANEEDVKDTFFWSWAPAFPMYRILPEEMRGLNRKLPRFFLVEDGVVKDVWNSLPEAEVVVAAAPKAGTEEMSH